jgi:protein-disulfide isomerase
MSSINLKRHTLVTALCIAFAFTFSTLGSAQDASDNGKAILEAASPLGDRVLGKADASVVLIEYASATCPHCAEFHTALLPLIKTEYIDTGKIKFIFREFPLDQMALGVFMLTRCLPEEKFFPVTDLMFRRQQLWMKAPNPNTEITKIMIMAGMDKSAFEACLKREDMARLMRDYAQKSAKDFGIKGTPALFLNGQMIDGHKEMSEVKGAIDAAIAKATK